MKIRLNTWQLIALALFVLMLTGACSHFAAMKGPFDGNAVNPAFVDAIVDRTESKLDFTQEQSDRFRQAVGKVMATALMQRPQNEKLKQELAESLRKPELDTQKIQDIMDRKRQAMRNFLNSGMKDLRELHATLAPEQREKLAQLVLEHGKEGWHDKSCW